MPPLNPNWPIEKKTCLGRGNVVIYSLVIRSIFVRFPFPEGKTMGNKYDTKYIKNDTTTT